MQSDLVISVEEAGRLLGISRGLSYSLARSGELPGCLRLGSRFVVARATLERALGLEQNEEAIPDDHVED